MSTSLMTTMKIFPNSGPPFVKIIDQVFIPLLQVLLHPLIKLTKLIEKRKSFTPMYRTLSTRSS